MARRTWSRTFAGTIGQVPVARRWVGALVGARRAAEAALLAGELASNAVLHTRSGVPGGQFGVVVTTTCARVRVEVRDGGSQSVPTVAEEDLEAPGGRGLLLVDLTAAAWGVSGSADGRTVWFELPQSRARLSA
ncbi:MAG: ATP-binding protein [Carbonactinosporaceae bacterium]